MFWGEKVKLQFPFLGTMLCLAQPSFTTHSNIALSKTAALRQQKCSGTGQQKAGLLHLGKAHILAAEQDGWKDPACCATGLSWMSSKPSVFIFSAWQDQHLLLQTPLCFVVFSPRTVPELGGTETRWRESCKKAQHSV